MSITVLRREDKDVSRRYWWAILLLFLAVGSGSLMLMAPSRGPGGGPGGSGGTAKDQSLESIDDALNSQGAPGGPVDLSMGGSGAYKHRDAAANAMRSSLYEPPSTVLNTGAPVTALSAAGSASAEAGGLVAALKNIAAKGQQAGGKDNKGWGDEKVRTGFTPPKANFGSMSGAGGGGGGGGSGASFGVAGTMATPFGVGGSNPGSGNTLGGVDGLPKVRKGVHNQAMDLLRKTEKIAQASTRMGADGAANLGATSYDGGGKSGAAVPGNPMSGGGISMSGDGVAENLKLDDPNLQKKDVQVPAVPPATDANGMDMGKMIMMMVITAAIGGILGPVFSGIGGAITGAMGMTPLPGYGYGNMNGATPTGNAVNAYANGGTNLTATGR